MSKREYPREVWVLTPSFKPVKVTVVARYASWLSSDYGDMVKSGKYYDVAEMYTTKEAAIAAGRAAVKKTQADICKRLENLNKRIAALDKAERDEEKGA